MDEGGAAGGDGVPDVPGRKPAIAPGLRPAVRARRAAARSRCAQGARGAWLRSDDLARGDARRSHSVDSRRDRGGTHLIEHEAPALSVVVPAYNEGENVWPTLRGIVTRTNTRPIEGLVVHDFDGDTTLPVVKRLQAELPELSLHRNDIGRGVLNALKSGLGAAKAPLVLVTMGDGSDDPGDIDAIFALASGGAAARPGPPHLQRGHHAPRPPP